MSLLPQSAPSLNDSLRRLDVRALRAYIASLDLFRIEKVKGFLETLGGLVAIALVGTFGAIVVFIFRFDDKSQEVAWIGTRLLPLLGLEFLAFIAVMLVSAIFNKISDQITNTAFADNWLSIDEQLRVNAERILSAEVELAELPSDDAVRRPSISEEIPLLSGQNPNKINWLASGGSCVL